MVCTFRAVYLISVIVITVFFHNTVHSRQSVHISSTKKLPLSHLVRGGFGAESNDWINTDTNNHRTQTDTKQQHLSPKVITFAGFPTLPAFDLNGEYIQTEWLLNGRSHYIRHIDQVHLDIHLYWSGTQWVLYCDQSATRKNKKANKTPPIINPDNQQAIVAYSKNSNTDLAMTSSSWVMKMGKKMESLPMLSVLTGRKNDVDHHDDRDLPRKIPQFNFLDSITKEKEILGIPRDLLPYYIAFAFDAIAVGLVMPLLPFTVMELGANAFELSLVVSSNYIAQSIGVTLMGRVSDTYGRKVVMTLCLMASTLSYLFLSRAESLTGFALARIISGSFGGLIPIIQSTVADSTTQMERPKYLGRIMATFGLGFVVGPAISALLTGWTTRQKIRLAGLLPFLGFLTIFFIAKETKKNVRKLDIELPFFSFFKSSASTPTATASDTGSSSNSGSNNSNGSSNSSNASGKFGSVSSPMATRSISPTKSMFNAATSTGAVSTPSGLGGATKDMVKDSAFISSPTPIEIYLLVLNGFCIMFAFATETIYAMFIKDSFGYGESILSTIFAINGLFIGLFQVFFIKPLISHIGKHATLALGNTMLAIGMIGVALIRNTKPLHFAFFAAHIVGYSIADTTLASLISKYSSPGTQGRDLAFNQAAQACARVVSPIVAGILYEYSKRPNLWLPLGALPFLIGAMCPLLALSIPSHLYWQKRARKRRQLSLFSTGGSLLFDQKHSSSSSNLYNNDFAVSSASEDSDTEGAAITFAH